ncbi:TIGR02678 family protein [Nitriliruptor alkaliphilus]|uniref:TIGR02678 family protein n=1 Tax=Nitriliruptor alkaliphilus TaxID=427918 RepID=UPI000698F242|nr:TIGR02678 family protein [Nitriliruptor alkaliphilus]
MILEQQQTDERGEAVRALLATPLITRDADPQRFRLLAVHRDWLAKWFDGTCGWTLAFDLTGGTARLVKRRVTDDASRPAVRPTDGLPFDQLRYVLLMCVAAELVSRPLTVISELADAIGVACAADETLPDFRAEDYRHRAAFTDVLRWLIDQRLVTITAGAIDRYASEQADAVLEADVARLALLPASDRAPSRIDAADTDSWLQALRTEPRYGELSDDQLAPEQRNLWARHTLIRAVLDDPAVDIESLDARVVDYLASLTGRRLLNVAATEAGLRLERHAEVIVAVDERREATDATFGDRPTTVAMTAGVLLGELVDHQRQPQPRTVAELETVVGALLAADPGWARAYQDERGARRLTGEALAQLQAFGLVHLEGDQVHARPAAARYRVTITDARRPADADEAATGEADPTTAPEPTDQTALPLAATQPGDDL